MMEQPLSQARTLNLDRITAAGAVAGRTITSDAAGNAAWAPGPLSGVYKGVTGYAYGNSWTNDGFATSAINRLMGKLGISMTNLGTGSYQMQDTAIEAMSPGTKTWTPNTPGVVVVMDLLNNLTAPDNTANRGAAFESARALCALLSSSSKTEQSTGTFSTTPAWIATAVATDIASAGTVALTAAEGAYVDLAVAAGTSYLSLAGFDGTTNVGGSFTVTQGSLSFTKDCNQTSVATSWRASTGISPVVLKMTGLAAGTVRITFNTLSRADAVGAVDCMLPQMVSPPTIVFVKPVPIPHSGWNNPSLLTYLRTIPDTLATEFQNVVSVDPNPGWNPATMIGPDQIHPNEAGFEHLANAILAKVVLQNIVNPVLTGQVVMKNVGDNFPTIASPAGCHASITYATPVGPRWLAGKENTPETGNNTGSNFSVVRYSDAGSNLGVPLSIARNNGVVSCATGMAHKTKAGAPVDADWAAAPPNGTMVIDTTTSKIWVRIGGTWKATAALT